MKKMIGIALWGMLAAVTLFAGSITVIQPNGGEQATLNGKLAIRWNAVDVSQNVRINLVRGGEVVGTIANNLASGAGYYLWDVAQLSGGGMAPAGNDYLVRIRAIDSSETDQSDQAFTIVAAPLPKGKLPASLKVEQPNGGESWRLGTEQTIRWSSHFLQGKVHLQLYRHNGSGVGTIADNLPASGSYAWKAGEYLGNCAPTGQYNIRVVAMDNYTVNDMSDAPFDLKPRLSDVVGPADGKLLNTVNLPGIYLVFPGDKCFPSYAHSQFPFSVYQAASAAFNTAACYATGANATAMAGIHWVTMSDSRFKIAAVYRSRIHFNLGPYAGQGGQLASAKLKMKRIHAIDQDANCTPACACAEYLAVLNAAMTSFETPASVGQSFPLSLGQQESVLDITGVVKQWLDGTMTNHGLLLMANEGVCSNCDRLCISCYEASLILKMD